MATFAVPRGEPVFREEDCSPFDIGLVYSTIAMFSDTNKFRIIQNIWKADVGCEFPVSLETGGNFAYSIQNSWFASLGLRIRSTSMALAFWMPCVCFGMECGKNGSRLDKLFRSQMQVRCVWVILNNQVRVNFSTNCKCRHIYLSFSDQQIPSKSCPKVQEMAFQRSTLDFKISWGSMAPVPSRPCRAFRARKLITKILARSTPVPMFEYSINQFW